MNYVLYGGTRALTITPCVHICEVQDGSCRTYLHVDSNVRGRDSIGEISRWRMLRDMKKEVHLQDDVLWNEHSLCVRR